MEQGLLRNEAFAEVVNEYAVPVIAHMGSTRGAGTEHQPVVDPATGEQVCPIYEGITCEAHRGTYSGTRGVFNFRGTPATFIAGPDGQVLFDSDALRSMSPGFFEEKFQEAQRRLGPGVPGSIWDALMHDMDEVDELIAEEEYRKAVRKAREWAEEDRLPEGIRAVAAERLEQLTDIGLERVAAALDAGDTRALRDLSREFRDLDEVVEAIEAAEQALED